MKKFIVLMMLCLLLCAVSATASAATISYFDANFTEKKIEVDGGAYTLPEYADVGFPLPEGETFYGWSVAGKTAYLKPGEKIDLKENEQKKIYAHYVNTDEQIYEVKYVSHQYNEHEIIGYYPCTPNELVEIMYPYQYGFGTAAENVEKFLYWSVEGEIEMYDDTYYNPDAPEAGWLRLFPRAFADDYATLNPGDFFYVKSDLTITAVWKDSNNGNPGGNGGNPGGNGGNPGGNNGNPGGNNSNPGENGGNPGGNNGNQGGNNGGTSSASKLPKTGDESLPMSLLVVLMAASLCGFAVLAKRKFN